MSNLDTIGLMLDTRTGKVALVELDCDETGKPQGILDQRPADSEFWNVFLKLAELGELIVGNGEDVFTVTVAKEVKQ